MFLRILRIPALLLFAFPCVAYAQQTPSSSEIAEARALFVAGNAAVEAGRWADAVHNFERSYALSRAPSALHNLGLALRSLGRYREARDALAKLIREHGNTLNERLRASAESAHADAAARVAKLTLLGLDPGHRYSVLLDGASVPDVGSRPFEAEVDPGPHAMVVERPGYELFRWQGRLEAGTSRAVDVVMIPRVPPPPPERRTVDASSRRQPQDTSTVFESPWFWIAVGVVAVGAAAVTGYVVYENAQLEPRSTRRVDL